MFRKLLIPLLLTTSISMAAVNVTYAADKDNVLRYGTVSEVANLDPHIYGGSAWKVMIGLMYSPLVQYNTDGEIVPGLAKEWEQPDPKTIIFKLRDDIKFHDGQPLTAEDVKYSIERIINPDTGATLRSSLDGISVDIIDPHTIKIQKDEPDATLLSVLALPEAAIVSEKWFAGDANLKQSANGTGPFELGDYEPSVRATLKKNQDYFIKNQPVLDAIDFRMIKSDEARVNALRTGDLDMIDFVPWKDIDQLRRDPSLKVDSAGGSFMNVWFNTAKPPFDDVKVRQAVSYAIDRDAISKAAFFGHGQPIYGAPTPPDSPFYNADLEDKYERDLDKAKELLSEAGYKDGLDAEMLVFQGLGIYTTTAQIIQANLKEAGIDLKLQPVEWATLVERKDRGDYESMVYGVSAKLPDPDAYTYYFGSGSSYWAKPVGYKDLELESLLDEARQLTSDDERKPIYKKVEERLLETSPWAFINWREQAQAYSDKVKGYHHLGGALNESSPAISLPGVSIK